MIDRVVSVLQAAVRDVFSYLVPSGAIKLDMSPVHDTPLACLSTELIPLLPVTEKNIRPIKEVLEFPSSEVYVPHNIYRWVRCIKMKVKTVAE